MQGGGSAVRRLWSRWRTRVISAGTSTARKPGGRLVLEALRVLRLPPSRSSGPLPNPLRATTPGPAATAA